jgi:hypothetical protein
MKPSSSASCSGRSRCSRLFDGATGFMVLLTVAVASHGWGDHDVWAPRCDDMQCVEGVIKEATRSPLLTRLRVFKADETGRAPVSRVPIWRPVLDLQPG